MFKIIGLFLLSLFLGSIIFSLISQYFFGLPYGWNIEATNSMVPILNPGCLVFIMPLIGKPHVGEIVAYKPPFYSHYIVHEIIKVLPNGYITKGVHNPTPDPWIVKRSWIKGYVPLIFGRPLAIPDVGYAITTLNTINGKVYLLVALFSAYAISEAVSKRNVTIKRRRRSINTKLVFLGLFILFFLVLFVIFSANTVLTYAQWTSVSVPASLSQKEIGVSFNLGVLPSNSNVKLILPIKVRNFPVKLPLSVLFYSNSSNLKLLGPTTISSSTNITFAIYTEKPGFYSDRVGFLLVPTILPYSLTELLFSISPLLFISFMSLFVSAVCVLIIYALYRILS